jgi:DNA-binding CsgD family transcriptional regulator
VARELAGEQLELARAAGAAQAIGIALRTAGAVAEGEDRIRLLREAVDVLSDSEARLDSAHAQVELGSALRAAGDLDGARSHLNAGMAAARACGATPLAQRAFEELKATGANPRKLVRGGLQALTPSERRVAGMAASGMSNKEIAQTLFVTVRTVETHLRHTYRKLDIGSREELERALAPDGAAV